MLKEHVIGKLAAIVCKENALTDLQDKIAVPRSNGSEAIRLIEKVSQRLAIPIINFGHAGDGNIHVNIMVDNSITGMEEKAHEAIREVF